MVAKKRVKKNNSKKKEDKKKLTFGQVAADWLTKWAGSWWFILSFLVFLLIWIAFNAYWFLNFHEKPFDPYPFILLNLMLSCLAAIQAPIILMSQNRQQERDRDKAERDYAINRKSEREVTKIIGSLRYIESKLNNMKKK